MGRVDGDFDVEGFLGVQAQDFRGLLRNRYGDLFYFAEALNRVGQEIKFAIEPKSDDATELFAAMLFTRIANSFASGCILASYGLCADARVVARSMLEALFHLGSCVTDEQYASAYELTQLVQLEKLMKRVVGSSTDDYGEMREWMNADTLRTLRQRIAEVGAKAPMEPWELSEKAGLRSLYDIVYRSLSEDVHIHPKALRRYLRGQELDWGPEISQIEPVLLTQITVMRHALGLMVMVFGGEYPELVELDQEFRTIAPKHLPEGKAPPGDS